MTNQELEYTRVLSPYQAINIVWGMTGGFSDNEASNQINIRQSGNMKDKLNEAENSKNEKEISYVTQALIYIESSLRSIDTAYKGRELNFKENEKLRLSHLESIKDKYNFGTNLKDFVVTLPTMSVLGVAGLSLTNLAEQNAVIQVSITIISAGLGIFISYLIVQKMRESKEKLYIRQDFERGIYFKQYIDKVKIILYTLYRDLDMLHKQIFGCNYPLDIVSVNELIDSQFEGIKPCWCKYVYKHMNDDVISSELWPLCETGDDSGVKQCKHWEK